MCVLPISVLLIIDYDILNITFVYLNFPNTVFFTAAIVIAPTIAAIFVKRGTWMQARAYTLAIYMMYIFSFEVLLSRDIGLQLSLPFPRSAGLALAEVGRASCRARGCQFVSISVVHVSLQNKYI